MNRKLFSVLVVTSLIVIMGISSYKINQKITPTSWPPEINNLKTRLDNIGLPALSEDGTALHTHQHLDLYIDSSHLVIPANIGINETQKFFAPIHTHDTTGIIHVESPTVETFTLGQFFDIWGIQFDDNCIDNYCSNSNKKLIVYNNGQLVQSNFRNLNLEPHQEIVIVFGSPPSLIPSSYIFPPRLLDYDF